MNENHLSSACASQSTTLTNYTMCPNWVYDRLLVEESTSVAKVVLYINRNTTGRTGPDGQRVTAVQASYTRIAAEMSMSLRAVGDAMRIALAKGYLIQTKRGRAPTATTAGEGGWYILNWQYSNSSNSYVNSEDIRKESTSSISQVEVTPEPHSKNCLCDKSTEATPVAKIASKTRQKLPAGLEQKLPPIINNPELKLNKPVEINTDEPKTQQAIQTISTSSSTNQDTITQSGKPNPAGKRKGSAALGRLISDFSRELGDNPALVRANIGRTLNLWQHSGLSEGEFTGLVYQARQKALASPTIQRRRVTTDGAPTDYPNRMPYFFAVLSELAGEKKSSGISHQPTAISRQLSAITPEREFGIDAVSDNQELAPDFAPLVFPQQARQPDWYSVTLAQLGWLTQAQRSALSQVELQPTQVGAGTHVRSELKFSRNWHASLFNQWELDRLAIELGAAGGDMHLQFVA